MDVAALERLIETEGTARIPLVMMSDGCHTEVKRKSQGSLLPLFTMQKSYKDGRGNEGAGQNQQDVAF